MKKRILFFAFIVLSTFCFAMGKSDEVSSSERIFGFIKWYGNAPVEFAGIETVEGQIFTLRIEEGSPLELKQITSLQGHLLQLDGRIEKLDSINYQVLKDGIFYVQKFEDLSAQRN